MEPRKCNPCGREFKPRTKLHVYCSPACAKAAERSRRGGTEPIEMECEHCGKSFVATQRRRFCTKQCAGNLGGRPKMTPGRVAQILDDAVEREVAMSWERHPQPYDPRDLAVRP